MENLSLWQELNSFLTIGVIVSQLRKHFKLLRNYIVLIIKKSVSRIMLNYQQVIFRMKQKNYSDEIKRNQKNHFVPEKEKHTQKWFVSFCLKYCWQRYSDIWVWEMRLIMYIGNRLTHKLFHNQLHIELFCSMTGPGRLSTRSQHQSTRLMLFETLTLCF